MGRAGVWHTRADAVFNAIRDAGNLRLAGVFTHFSSSDDDPEFTALQRRRFLGALKKGLPRPAPEKLLVHADNSAGLESIDTAGPFNAVRVGLLQFGVLPKPGALLSGARVEPVFSFHTRVGLVKRLPAGTDISYGRTRRLRRASTVAVLTAGYGDGLSRALSNRGSVLIGGRRRPILGRVTMDQTIVDVTDAPSVRVGDEAVLIGRQGDVGVSLAEFSEASGTIPWETLCSVTKRVPRIYKNSREV
jgi:alanine racemase